MTYDLGVFKRQRYVYPTFNAVGGTISYYTNEGIAYTVHTFLSTGTNNFTIFSTATVDMLLVGGGAGGGGSGGIGGDAGQFVTATNVTLNIGQYNVTVGNGGISNSTGSSSSIVGSVNITHATTATGGASQTGAGAGGPGSISNDSGVGGPGLYNDYNGTNTAYAGGGGNGGSGFPGNGGAGGVGGGGNGASYTGNQVGDGTPNTGGGGGGNAAYPSGGGYGGSGIVIIRYQTPQTAIIPPNDIYFNYVSLLLSNQTTNVTTPTSLSPVPAITFDYLIVAGGGGGNGSPTVNSAGGGGGAGGLIYGTSNNVLLPNGSLSITVGSGGAIAGNGNSSSINSYTGLGFQAGSTSTIIAIGGGEGGYGGTSPSGAGQNGDPGGSGGGGGGSPTGGSGTGTGGASNKITYSLGTDVSSTSLGNSGGNGILNSLAAGGGGGGAGGVGSGGAQGSTVSGGAGYTWLNGNTYAAGGGSHNYQYGAPASVAGASFTGNGGDGNGGAAAAAAGGSGIVIIRYSGTNVLATGGTISTVSNYVYHTFTTTGVISAFTTTPSSTGTNYTSSVIRYLLVGGGGGSGVNNYSNTPGGGGAGGLFTGTFTITNITTLLSITVGAGGGVRGTGGNSSITSNYVTKTAYGGGAGADGGDGGPGGSGGGAGASNSGSGAAAAGGTNLNGPGTAAGGYGNVGGSGSSSAYGGGGGAGGAGQSAGVAGGIGLYINTPYSAYSKTYATGGSVNGSAAPPNTGNGGGGDSNAGGAGISIVWEPYTNPMPSVIGAPTIVTTSGYRVYVFTSTGALVYGNSLSNTKFTDNSTNSYPILYNGNPSQGSFNPYAKNWSVYFNGSSYLSIPNSASYGTTRLNLDSNSNFTIEGWAYFNSVSAGILIAHEYTIWRIGVASGTLQYSLSSNGSNYAGIASSISMGTVVVGRWYHFALVRNGSTFTPYLNGIAGTPTISSASLYAGTNEGLTIGMGDTNNYFSGYLSNIRILKGTAFYTAPFTPAISPLPLVSNTLLLTCSNSTWDDVSDYNWSIIPKGIPAVKKFSPFSNFGSYNPTLVGGSAYFNGSTDYLTIGTTSTTNVPNWTYLHDGTTDYTIEGWIYPLSTATQQGLIGTSDIGNTAVSGMALYLTSGGVLSWAIMNGSASFPSSTVSNSVRPNSWNHVACTFASSSKITNIYINGFKLSTTATTTSSFTATSASYPLTIGRSAVSTLNTYSGYISNLRILKGVVSDGVVASGISSGSTIEYLVVAGGGGAPSSGNGRGGGGAGGFRTGTFITIQSGAIYTITVGGGGNGGNVTPTNGGDSSIVSSGLSLVSAGGGAANYLTHGSDGGSGGGASSNLSAKNGGTGNTPPTVPAQGYNGGNVTAGTGGGGGGGASGPGANTNDGAGAGGAGALSNIDGLGYYYAGGGGGYSNPGTSGGTGGGAGTNYASNTSGRNLPSSNGNGGLNTGGGGYGGFSTGGAGGGGGSGCVIVRYFGPQRATGGNIITTNVSGYTVHTFLSSGVFVDNSTSYTIPVAPVVASSTATNLLLNFTDSVIVDASSNTDIYTGGDAGLASPVKKYNNMSMYFDGTTGTGLTISTSSAVALGSTNFTVEMWMYPLASYNSGNAPALLDARTTGDGAGLIRFGFNGTTIYGGPQIAWRENVTSIVTATVILNVWQHIAVVRNSGVLTIYNNGTAISSTSNSTDLIVPFKYIARTYNNLPFNGYIDDLRITNGIARYTTAFIPPIQKLQLK